MKRIHLFEFEDFTWFPGWLRACLTRLINVMHKLLRSEDELVKLLTPLLKETKSQQIIDLCSGSGGPMPGVAKKLQKAEGMENLQFILSDLYPDLKTADNINAQKSGITYLTKPVDATQPNEDIKGIRTMICSFHHMPPEKAKRILEAAYNSKQPICIYEISDNSMPPTPLWWIAIPFNIISCFFITPMVRPMSLQQIVFTYFIPIIPLFFAWDGAVSNARTYALSDLDVLLEDLRSDHYTWEKGTIGRKTKKLFLIGKPT